MTIGDLAKRASVNVQTVRFYERQGVLQPPQRKDSGYRIYDETSLRRLIFVRHAKELGFSLKEIKDLLNLRVRSLDRCDKVKARADLKLKEIQKKIRHLMSLESTLKNLIRDCQKRVVSDCCPIIDKMELT